SAVPTGGAGVALPPGICTLTCALIFASFFAMTDQSSVEHEMGSAESSTNTAAAPAPRTICTLHSAFRISHSTLVRLAPRRSQSPLQSFRLPMFEVDRGGAAKNLNQNRDLAGGFVYRFHGPFEALERPFLDLHRVADLEADLDPGLFVRLA